MDVFWNDQLLSLEFDRFNSLHMALLEDIQQLLLEINCTLLENYDGTERKSEQISDALNTYKMITEFLNQ